MLAVVSRLAWRRLLPLRLWPQGVAAFITVEVQWYPGRLRPSASGLPARVLRRSRLPPRRGGFFADKVQRLKALLQALKAKKDEEEKDKSEKKLALVLRRRSAALGSQCL